MCNRKETKTYSGGVDGKGRHSSTVFSAHFCAPDQALIIVDLDLLVQRVSTVTRHAVLDGCVMIAGQKAVSGTLGG